MFRRFSTNFAILSILIDIVLILIMLPLANQLRPFLSELPFAMDIRKPMQIPFLLYPLFVLIWIGIFLLLDVYDGRRNLHVTDEFGRITLGSILAAVSIAGTLYLSYRDVSRLLFLIFIILTYGSILSWRIFARLAVFRGNGTAVQKRRVLIIGAGPVGTEIFSKIEQHPYLGLMFSGFLDDDPVKKSQIPGVLGIVNEARQIVIEEGIQDVVIALPRRAHEQVNQVVSKLHDMTVKIWVVPDYFHLALHKAVVEDFAGIPMLDLRAPALNEYQRLIKRAFDLLIGTMILIFVIPFMVIIAIAIKIDSSGPILFKQYRVGENGRLFWMYKFRSMVIDADKSFFKVMGTDNDGNLIYKKPNDPRITKIGKFIRRTSLDELPQLFNVLKGEMSLVGPRPELPLFVEKYEQWQRVRFAVPQGITGWWQVNGRSSKPMHLHTEDDLYYVQNYSLLLDVRIMFKTVGAVLRRKGAF